MLKGKAALALWIDVDPASRHECDRWYVERHIADRVRLSGWRRARRYRAAEGTQPGTFALYEVDTPEQLVSDAYLTLQRDVNEQDRRMRAAFSNVVRGTFRIAHSMNGNGAHGEGGVMLSLRFAPDATSIAGEAAQHRVARTVMPGLAAAPGVIGVHLMISMPEWKAQHDAHRRSGSTDADAHWVLLVEATEEDRARAVLQVLGQFGGVPELGLADGACGIYRLMYAARNVHDKVRP